MSTNPEDDFLIAVKKDSTTRLVLELARAQDVISEEDIAGLSRPDLITYVTHLRRLSGVKTAIKSKIADFDISKVIFPKAEEATLEEAEGATGGNPTPGIFPGHALTSDPTTLLLTLFQSMQAANDKRESEARALRTEENIARERREAIREKREADERAVREKRDADLKLELVKKEALQEKRDAFLRSEAAKLAAECAKNLAADKAAAKLERAQELDRQEQLALARDATARQFHLDNLEKERQCKLERSEERRVGK